MVCLIYGRVPPADEKENEMLARLFDSPLHLLILVLVVVIVFGWKKLPDAARSLGRSARILKSEMGEMQGDSTAKDETVKGERAETVPDNATSGSGATAASQKSDRIPGEAPAPHAEQKPSFDEQGNQRS